MVMTNILVRSLVQTSYLVPLPETSSKIISEILQYKQMDLLVRKCILCISIMHIFFINQSYIQRRNGQGGAQARPKGPRIRAGARGMNMLEMKQSTVMNSEVP